MADAKELEATAPGKWPWPVQIPLDILCGTDPVGKYIPPLLWLADAALTSLIIWKVPYTEIDWVAYMQQIKTFLAGERDYTLITGQTGPLVYPAAHVYTFTGLYYLTDHGENILLAQQIFGVLYMATLALVMLCYGKAKMPPYVFALLIVSKRLHSVFVLRCFNDCFAALFLWLTIYLFQRRFWTFGAVAFSLGLGIKMSLLVALPAVVILLFMGRGFWASLRLIWLMVQIQFALAVPFLAKNAKGYFGKAFELSRQFKYEWTVNWRFVPEDIFLSRGFALTLLAGHVTVLSAFIIHRWIKPADRTLLSMLPSFLKLQSPFTAKEEIVISSRLSPDFVMSSILTCMVIGMLFARSLHYQFYAYVAWSTPYLIARAFPNNISIALAFSYLQEDGWNTFPSTPLSSLKVVGTLAVAVAGMSAVALREDRSISMAAGNEGGRLEGDASAVKLPTKSRKNI
ncbi:Dol-P-Man:Man(5)GlcNAc(2)-PP-Dol alpha-mannosyltransferase-like protein [Emericellopsis cladophorae]|uniref:Dol-P-Man:Man(5)GlcNAc(2)-PP-Dol alpha-1,3-mannosyltransferase n=1 Tax=Emericellopsis cladophorae TaxID=2686198 RepID=A0A9P9Y413_9HYPO|nr:Dol-P-Man:Man(5)GlcNAc(2)-PP-Dol alpha-mannosyltransferase-like protein [Emericellopsis cladophorae]KAI6782793.1 Dol-P-Man:Man(5)GlcNAc(2)-PP-Dol alpha-mannosyltransferase-like protein [Emericellopsis cladophorae]